ncbi:MAG TPA: CHAT domain-containing tetratricopeptide repeat protein [Pirellulales bacterium]|nr:CHAT domain-containing tetratricopeptide repeat protein [Pirellulales bacterium]
MQRGSRTYCRWPYRPASGQRPHVADVRMAAVRSPERALFDSPGYNVRHLPDTTRALSTAPPRRRGRAGLACRGTRLAALLFCLAFLVHAPALQAGEKEDYNAAFTKAEALEAKADYRAAARQYERALALSQRAFGNDAVETAVVLSNLAHVYRNMGEFARAEPLYQRTLKLFESALGPNEPGVATILNNLAALNVDMGQYIKAEPLYQRSLKIREAKLGPDHRDVAISLNNIGILYQEMGRHAEAEPLYQRSLKIWEAKLGPDHLDVALCLNNLAYLYSEMGRYAEAEPLYQRSLSIREAKLGPRHPDVSLSLDNLASLYGEMAQYTQAESLHKRSLKIREAVLGKNHPAVANSLNNLALVSQNLGQYAQAERLFQRSLKIWEAKLGPDHPLVATSAHNLAALYDETGRYAQAEPLYVRSLKIKEAKLGPDHPDLAGSLDKLAQLYGEMGQYAQAEPLYQRSLKIRETKFGPDHPHVAGSRNNLAVLYDKMGRYAEAEPLYQRSLKIWEAVLGPDHPEVGLALSNLAELYRAMGRYVEAEPLQQRSLKIREAALGPDHVDVASSLNNLAILYKDMGQYAQAEPLYLRSLKMWETKLGPDHPNIALSLDNLAALYEEMHENKKAATEVDLARRIVRKHIARVLPVLSTRQQLTFLQKTDEGRFNRALTLGWRHQDDAPLAEQSASWLLNGKAVVQESLAEQARLARDSQDPEIGKRIKKLTAVRGELAALSQVAPEAGKEAGHGARLADLVAHEQELSRQVNLAAGRPALDEPWIEPAAVRKALADEAVLIDIVCLSAFVFEAKHGEEYWRAARYVAWVVPPAGQGDVRIVDLGEADAIDRAVEAARQAIERSAREIKRPLDDEENAEQTTAEALSGLAELMLAPLLPAVGDAKELILSPDSQLWLVPWAALPLDDGKYAVERWRIRYVTSGRDVVLAGLTENQKTRPTTRPRIFADPDFDLDGKATAAATRAVLRGKEKELATRGAAGLSQSRLAPFARLRGTATEAKLITPAITALAHEAPTVYSEQYALEGVLKMIASPRVLVLSTHGFYFADQEAKKDDERALLATTGENQHRGAVLASDGTPLENPLLRCGLALAGCNKPRGDVAVDDGIVTGMEIVGLDLRGTELVVLSACETGLGQVRNGEGVAGLRQAFQLAGAKAVVSTLWKIPDAETVALMTDFFNHLAAGESKAAALRNAQLAQIKTRRDEYGAAHPYYWAAFTVTGN